MAGSAEDPKALLGQYTPVKACCIRTGPQNHKSLTNLLVGLERFSIYCVRQFNRHVVISDGTEDFVHFPDLLFFLCVDRSVKVWYVLNIGFADYIGLAGVCEVSKFLDLERRVSINLYFKTRFNDDVVINVSIIDTFITIYQK